MRTRPATPTDVPAIAALQARYDRQHLGSPQESEAEVAESLARITDPVTNTLLILASSSGESRQPGEADNRGHDGGAPDDRLLGVGLRWRAERAVVVDPDVTSRTLRRVHDVLVDWLEAGPAPSVEVPATDTGMQTTMTRRGWRHRWSSVELERPVTTESRLPSYRLPEGIVLRDQQPSDDVAIHDLIYRRAGWADVPGHKAREFEEWAGIFCSPAHRRVQQVVAVRGETLVGAAIGRTYDDGTGYVNQLAVAADERGRGLGRALLLASLAARQAEGATTLGLSVVALNLGALRLYRSVGLEIVHEWQDWAPPDELGVV